MDLFIMCNDPLKKITMFIRTMNMWIPTLKRHIF